jgi:serine/threonine-protein kinase
MRKEELRFAQKVVRNGLLPGNQMLECIEALQSGNNPQNLSLMDVLVHKGYLTRDKVKEIELETKAEASDHNQAAGSQPLAKVGCYELLAKIGEGGMGLVYKARHATNGRLVALKLLDHELARDKEFITRFLREARNVAKLKRHDNIVEAYDFGESDGKYYFAMEFVDGRSLAEILYGKGRIDEKTALHITKQVAEALKHANHFSIVHRDIKPENIMISRDGVVKLCDLGLAKDMSENFYKWGGVTLGTAYYASPEQSSGRKNLVDIRSDIYSLGISLYHMLAGEPPFNDSNTRQVANRHIEETLPPLTGKAPEVSKDTLRLLNKMTAKNVQDRYQTPEELVEEIDILVHGRTTPIPLTLDRAKPAPLIQTPPRPVLKKRKWAGEFPDYAYVLMLVCGVVVFLLLAVGILWYIVA